MIRLYGMSLGNGSYARVTRGVKGALERMGLLSGFVPFDAMDEWDSSYGGMDAPVAVAVAPQTPEAGRIVATNGIHGRRAMLLPLNSTFCPPEMLKLADASRGRPLITEWLTPSEWSAERIRALTSVPVSLWQHGVSAEFCANDAELDATADSYSRGEFRVLHLTSTPRQRKGTVQLIRAWDALVSTGSLPEKAKLVLVLPGSASAGLVDVALSVLPRETLETIESVLTPLNLPDAEMARLYRSTHLVAQPSRGEGFGMVPLEALCCGVPVVATACSGHSEFLRTWTPGLSLVEHGSDTRIDDGPDALAPSVSDESVRNALLSGCVRWKALQSAARDNAHAMCNEWSWDAVMRRWAKKEGWIQ